MKIARKLQAASLAVAVLASTGCAHDGAENVPRETASSLGSVSGAEQLALVLADADHAFAAGERQRLTNALHLLDRLGATPLNGAVAELQRWRAAAIQGPPMRGRPLGPGYRSGQVRPGATEQLEQVFLSGKRASIALSSPGNSRLVLEVQNGRDDTVCKREPNPNHCQWVPMFTDRYRIRIANPGKKAARYFLVIE